jgi:hypothetical protein
MEPSPRTSASGIGAASVGLARLCAASAVLSGVLAATGGPAVATTWQAIDALRARLASAGVTVVQRDCPRRGLQGLYHSGNDTIVICRAHRTPAAVWNTLAHEATHRMQACAGGSITHRHHHRAMAGTLASYSPDDLRSLQSYPRGQQLAELEARYTAQLPPEQVLRLFDRYCTPSSASQP